MTKNTTYATKESTKSERARSQKNVSPEDLAHGLLSMTLPRTAGEYAAWLDRRDRFRIAVCRWAVAQARADWLHFNAGREAVRMVRLLGLTRAEDARVRGLANIDRRRAR